MMFFLYRVRARRVQYMEQFSQRNILNYRNDFPTNKTDHHDTTDILLMVALSTNNQ